MRSTAYAKADEIGFRPCATVTGSALSIGLVACDPEWTEPESVSYARHAHAEEGALS